MTKEKSAEIFFGIVGAVGSDVDYICRCLESELIKARYNSHVIHLSRLLSDCYKWQELRTIVGRGEDERISSHMTAGNQFRAAAHRGDAMILLGINKITSIREQNGHDLFQPLTNTAYIFRSLKHPDEVKTLRDLYRSSFFLISIYTSRETRQEALALAISRSRGEYSGDQHAVAARDLINRDEKEDNVDLGQNVRETFYLANLFVDGNNQTRAAAEIERFIEILFGNPFRTPTVEEFAMSVARTASLRSADLARQVGAVIIGSKGRIISVGCNEVPSAGGGYYWESNTILADESDHRDHAIGYDSTARMKREIISELIARFKASGWIASSLAHEPDAQLTDKAVGPGQDPILKGSRVDSILEFGRIVHAEMAAISEAARTGAAVEGATLYCTTFPCHMCARHIVTCGIVRVVYVEPYPKSLAKELYGHAIRVDHDTSADGNAVSFEPFVGIAPRRFREFFEMVGARKDGRGYKVSWSIAEGTLRVREFITYTENEKALIAYLNKNAVSLGVLAPSEQTGETE